MLDGECSFKFLKLSNFFIWWGAYLGMEKQIIHNGYLHEVSENIIELRNDARKKYGWIMDTYLLQKIN
jgi:precorrin-6A synthase